MCVDGNALILGICIGGILGTLFGIIFTECAMFTYWHFYIGGQINSVKKIIENDDLLMKGLAAAIPFLAKKKNP